jgi:hypothetical protein
MRIPRLFGWLLTFEAIDRVLSRNAAKAQRLRNGGRIESSMAMGAHFPVRLSKNPSRYLFAVAALRETALPSAHPCLQDFKVTGV